MRNQPEQCFGLFFQRSERANAAGTVTATDIIAWCRERMPQYMVPRTVVFLAEMPKTSTGKIQKYVLRNLAVEMGPARKGVTGSRQQQ